MQHNEEDFCAAHIRESRQLAILHINLRRTESAHWLPPSAMYTEDDLELAVREGVLTRSSVSGFQQLIQQHRDTAAVDEENFRLIASFNDVFVTLACLLLVLSSTVLARELISPLVAALLAVMMTWALAEFFVSRKKMALPGIALLLIFAGGIFYAIYKWALLVVPDDAPVPGLIALAVTLAALYGHWRRFKVPVTIALGAGIGTLFVVGLQSWLSPNPGTAPTLLVALCGLTIFGLAMYWDASDRQRISYRADVAFWLHLICAPMVIYPCMLALFDGVSTVGVWLLTGVLVSYLFMILVSLVIDRRAFIVSSMVSVLYVLARFLGELAVQDYSLTIAGIFTGSSLLLLSVFWHPARQYLVRHLPQGLRAQIPGT